MITIAVGCPVTLDYSQIKQAATEAINRQVDAMRRGGVERYPDAKADVWERKVQACGSELAVSIALNLRWSAVHDGPGGPDVGDNVEVKWRKDREDGDLFVRPDCRDDYVYVLVTGRIPTFILAGWLWGTECKQYGRLHPGLTPPTLLVPRSRLRPIAELLNP